MDSDSESIRERLLEASLKHVPFDGWSLRSLRAGADDLGLSHAVALNAFPGGGAELLEAFSRDMDQRMLAELETRDLEALRLRDKVSLAVRTRLELLEPHQEAVRRGLGFLALPFNAALATRLLYRTVDAIWHGVGDRSTDHNFYSKRLLLAGVYSATLLVWLNDHSERRAETWAFLERRLDNVLRIGMSYGRSLGALLDLPDRLIRRSGRTGLRGH